MYNVSCRAFKMIKDVPIFNFQAVFVANAKEIIIELKIGKAVSGEIPVKLLKDCNFVSCIN